MELIPQDISNKMNEVINGNVEHDAGSPPKKSAAKKLTVEKIYQKKTQLEHILLRPDTYIGKELCLEKFCFLACILLLK